MPTRCGLTDAKGTFCRWGGHGAHYYYTPGDKSSMERARKKADKQGAAAHASGYQGSKDDIEDLSEEVLEKASGIQSLRFKKSKFNRSKAISWAKSHGFKSGNVEETPNEWRLRQFPPSKCIRSGGMKRISDGVMGYICPTKSTIKKSGLEELKGYLEELKDIVPEKTVEKESKVEEKEESKSGLKVNDSITYKGRTGKIVEIIE